MFKSKEELQKNEEDILKNALDFEESNSKEIIEDDQELSKTVEYDRNYSDEENEMMGQLNEDKKELNENFRNVVVKLSTKEYSNIDNQIKNIIDLIKSIDSEISSNDIKDFFDYLVKMNLR